MKTKTLIMVLALALVALLMSTVEVYRSEWNTNHSATTVTTNPADGQDYTISWGSMLVAPLESALVNDKHNQAFVQALRQQIGRVGFGIQIAPREMNPGDIHVVGGSPLLVSLDDFKLTRTLTGWRAKGTAQVESIRLTSDPREKEIQMTINVQAEGIFRGWLKRTTVEKQLVERISYTIAKGMHDTLKNQGMLLPQPPTPPSDSGSGFSWWFSFSSTRKAAPEGRPDIEHPLLLPEATVDYLWDTPDKTVLIYRVNSTAPDLEQNLLARLEEMGQELSFDHFVNSVNNRRKLMTPSKTEITHWDTASTLQSAFAPWVEHNNRQNESVERYVLVVLGK